MNKLQKVKEALEYYSADRGVSYQNRYDDDTELAKEALAELEELMETQDALRAENEKLWEDALWLFGLIYDAAIPVDKFEYRELKEIKERLEGNGDG